MKLDFESNASHASLIDDEFRDEDNLSDGSAAVSAQLRAGIEAAQSGARAAARHLLSGVTEIDPANESAWLWLASISEYPEELLGFLNHVLEINPNNAPAAERARATKNLLAKNFVERGADASKNSRRKFARQCFSQAIALDEENEAAWLWLASVSDEPEEKTAHLGKVLSLNPENENAAALLRSVKNQKADHLLQKAVSQAISGKREAAKQMLEETLNDAPEFVDAWVLKSFLVESFEEKIECFERILDIDDENEMANLNWTALLDIMAKAEPNTQISAAGQTTSAAENNFDESKASTFLLAPDEDTAELYAAPGENFEAAENFQAIESNLDQPAAGKEFFDAESPAELLSDEEDFNLDEEDSANTANAAIGDSEDIARINSNDFQPEAESFHELAGDDSPSDADELQIPHEIAPSYYGSAEESIADFSETAPDNYFQELTQNEPDLFAGDFTASKAAPFFDEKEIGAAAEFSEETKAGELEKIGESLEVAEEMVVDADFTEEKSSNETIACPFCSHENDQQAFVCGVCRTMLTLSDLEMLLAHQTADREMLRQAVERMEEEKTYSDFGVEEFKLLAIGQINLKNLRQGCAYLNEAAQLNPNDVVLSSQVNSLKIRLSEIEEQQSIHDSMPQNRKILVVDDSITVRKLISGKLEKSGHEVICAIDGIDALEQIKEFVPDLILLDINMPRMDGYQVCKLIRSNESTRDVPIVMISGKDGFFDKVRGRMAGTTGYITKPFGPETLMKTIDTYIVDNG